MLQYPDFTGPIYMTPATWEIYSATLNDTIENAKGFTKDLKISVRTRIINQKTAVFSPCSLFPGRGSFCLFRGERAYPGLSFCDCPHC
jgi:hypothetical protein